jgi:hypothetical protein
VPEPKGERRMGEPKYDADGAQATQAREAAPSGSKYDLTVTTEAHQWFTAYFDDYRLALDLQRKNIREFDELPDVVLYESAKNTNEFLSRVARDNVLASLDNYITYLDDFKKDVDDAIRTIQAHDQAT